MPCASRRAGGARARRCAALEAARGVGRGQQACEAAGRQRRQGAQACAACRCLVPQAALLRPWPCTPPLGHGRSAWCLVQGHHPSAVTPLPGAPARWRLGAWPLHSPGRCATETARSSRPAGTSTSSRNRQSLTAAAGERWGAIGWRPRPGGGRGGGRRCTCSVWACIRSRHVAVRPRPQVYTKGKRGKGFV